MFLSQLDLLQNYSLCFVTEKPAVGINNPRRNHSINLRVLSPYSITTKSWSYIQDTRIKHVLMFKQNCPTNIFNKNLEFVSGGHFNLLQLYIGHPRRPWCRLFGWGEGFTGEIACKMFASSLQSPPRCPTMYIDRSFKVKLKRANFKNKCSLLNK